MGGQTVEPWGPKFGIGGRGAGQNDSGGVKLLTGLPV